MKRPWGAGLAGLVLKEHPRPEPGVRDGPLKVRANFDYYEAGKAFGKIVISQRPQE
jgi:hypothetical protein